MLTSGRTGRQNGILHRKDAAGHQVWTHLSWVEADGAVAYHSENFQSAASRDAAAIGGAREGMPRQSRILRIASGGRIAVTMRSRPPQLAHSRTSIETTPIMATGSWLLSWLSRQ